MNRTFFLLLVSVIFICTSYGQVVINTYSIDPDLKTKLDKKVKSFNGIKRGAVDFKIFNDDKIVADTKGESLSNATISYLMNDTILIKAYLGMYGAYGYQILIFKDGTYDVTLFAESETPGFKIHILDSLETDLIVESRYKELALVSSPKFEKGEIVEGVVEIIGAEFYKVESGKESKVRIEVRGYISTDSLRTLFGYGYKKLDKGFYRGPDGRLFIKTQSLIHPPEEYGPEFYRPVPDIDVPTFELLCPQGWYARDKDSVYIVDGTSDGKHIWVLKKADASTFECINYRWGKDKNYVFENGIILEGLDPQTMIIIDRDSTGYFQMVKDGDQVFYGYKEIKGVDVNSFRCTRNDTSSVYEDKNWIYREDYFLTGGDNYRTRK